MGTALFAALIAANELDAPSAKAWDDLADPLPIVTLATAGIAFLYGASEPLRSRRLQRAEELRESEEGVAALCRRAFVPINRTFPRVPISQVGVHVWRVKRDESELERVYKYTMEHQRPETALRWIKGRGAIGMAWQTRQVKSVTSFGAVVEQAKAHPTNEAFEAALSKEERAGLSRDEVLQAPHYEAILAVPLSSKPSGRPPHTVGVFSVDFRVDVDSARLETLLHDPDFQDILGSCENYLKTLFGEG